MTENFAELFQKSLEHNKIFPGNIITGTVVNINDKFIFVDVGLKSEGLIPREEFTRHKEPEVKVGDKVEVMVETIADHAGATQLSKEKARRAATWARLTTAYENTETIMGFVQGKVKGGLTVDIDGVKAFLPGSLIDLHIVSNTSEFEGQELEFKIIKIDNERNNIVVSRRAVIEALNSSERSKLLDSIEEGQILKGIVKNLTDYGAFVDLGGIDGLLHITDISWKRIKSPGEALNIGDEITVVVLKFEKDRNRISLGMKQLSSDPWVNIQMRYPKNTQVSGHVTNIADYGCFVEVEPGIEGLVHMSEIDWTNKNINPAKIVHIGDVTDVMILEIDEERRRIALSIKQCHLNPWKTFEDTHKPTEVVKGMIRSITDFGIFIGLEGGIDGLIHLSDISWTEPGEQAIHNYQKGQEVEAVILAIDPDKERISLGIKQLQNDPFGNFAAEHQKGTLVKGKVILVEPKQARVELASEVIGRLKASEFSVEKVEDLTVHLKEGDEIEAKVISINHKDRLINLSIRLKDSPNDTKGASLKKKKADDTPTQKPLIRTTIGDLLKEQIDNQIQEEEDEEDEDGEKIDREDSTDDEEEDIQA